ncbi:MAG: glutamyl-tRNA reductase [Treponema sp.]|nr:glutamyl-tRNA reductase [Treponema sp.]
MEIRRLFSFTKSQAAAFLSEFCSGGKKAVLVATCNRTELYVSCDRAESDSLDLAAAISEAQEAFALAKQQDVQLFREHCRSYTGEDAVRHLFSVAAGLDSMVLGENEILGQLRESYKEAAAQRHTGFYLNQIFQRALSCAKRVKTETNLSKATESIATLAVKEVMAFSAEAASAGKVLSVLLIGASGQTGSLIARDLAERDGVQVFATVRRQYGLPELPHTEKIAYEERYAYLDRADVVISATRSPHCTVSYSDAAAVLHTKKKRLFIDLAVPNDIAPELAAFDGITLKNIDCFTRIAREHNQQKKEGAEKASLILAEEIDATVKELIFHDNISFVQEFGRSLDGISALQFLYDMRTAATAEELELLLSLWDRMQSQHGGQQPMRRGA